MSRQQDQWYGSNREQDRDQDDFLAEMEAQEVPPKQPTEPVDNPQQD